MKAKLAKVAKVARSGDQHHGLSLVSSIALALKAKLAYKVGDQDQCLSNVSNTLLSLQAKLAKVAQSGGYGGTGP